MQQFYLMVLAVALGICIVGFFTNVVDLIWPLVERGLEKWAASD